MRIRQIELVGFKSFREATRLVLAPGINAVVGPNGCGKSNVADAIRWALGEQSVKHLRAREMEDVIFGGNASSAPLNFAEVSLTFEQGPEGEGLDLGDDVEGLAAHVARQHEFTITRRIFRSGDSQYLVNQSPARLRDITELFLGSGVGPKAYAMIEQGRVGQIVNAKPEEVRLFIEEAAGTTRFRSRKLAAERKLERTSDNLSRVQDVMREIERQLATLRRQARRAEEYRQLEGELTRTEAALAGSRWHGLSAEQSKSREDLDVARSAAAVAQRELAEAEGERSAASEREQRATAEIETAFAVVAESSAAVVRATERQTAARDAAATRRARLDRIAEEIAGLDADCAATEASLQQAEADRATWIERERDAAEGLEVADREVGELAPIFDRAQQEHAASGAGLEEVRRRVAAAAAEGAKSSERLAGLSDERGRIEARLADRSAELSGVEGRLAQAGETRSAARRAHDRLEEHRRSATGELRAREDEQRQLGENATAIRDVLVHRRGRLDGLREREGAFDGYAEGLAAAMGFDPRPRGLVLDGLAIPPELEPAVAAVLGDALRGAVVESPEDAAEIASALRRTGAGRITLVPAHVSAAAEPGGRMDEANLGALIAATPGSENVRDALFRSVALVDDLAAGVAAWRRGEACEAWVTRAGDMIDRHGVVTGGRTPESADLLQRRRELGELVAQIAEDELRQATLEHRIVEVRAECAALGADLKRLDGEAHAATLALVASQHDEETAGRERTAAERRVGETRAEIDACERSIAIAQAALDTAASEARGAAEAERVAAERLAHAESELDQHRTAVEGARARRDGRREALSAAREALARAAGLVGRLEHERSIASLRREALLVESRTLARELGEGNDALVALEAELTARGEELRAGEAAVEAAREAARRTQLELREQESRVARARGLLEEAREQCQAIELRLAELGAQIDALVSFTRDRLGIEPSGAEIPEGFEPGAASDRIQELKDRIVRLGDVNVAAIADAKELEERYGFLEAQRSDLEASIADLRQTIAELSRTTRARFRETFELANQKFQEYFAELFRGGKAGLKLTHPQNLLETGVEMEVQPPGKSLRTLESLSGGEKALTAISLLMALFSLRATPFCVLDEVDAPLDEANLGRFNAMIQRMATRTQFIVITHHQQTMESAHVLYGVTMAEAGVSQLVSVELARREGESGPENDPDSDPEIEDHGLAMAASA